MRHFALIGNPLGHSYSKRLFDEQHFAEADYRLCPMATLDALRPWVQREGIDGFNVTVPHKQSILPLLDGLSPAAAQIGAVNCVVVGPDGRLTGHNTDGPAFLATLADMPLPADVRAFVLGTGGAAQAVAWALAQRDIPFRLVSRQPDRHSGAIAYADLLAALRSPLSTLLVNATPVGTWPHSDSTPLPDLWSCLEPAAPIFLYDLVYNPSPTLLMRQAQRGHAQVKDGLAMLRTQARLSWRLWGLE